MKARITITIDEEFLRMAEDAIASGQAKSVSAWIGEMLEEHAQQKTAQDIAGEILRETGGPLTKEEEAWAEALFERSSSTPAH